MKVPCERLFSPVFCYWETLSAPMQQSRHAHQWRCVTHQEAPTTQRVRTSLFESCTSLAAPQAAPLSTLPPCALYRVSKACKDACYGRWLPVVVRRLARSWKECAPRSKPIGPFESDGVQDELGIGRVVRRGHPSETEARGSFEGLPSHCAQHALLHARRRGAASHPSGRRRASSSVSFRFSLGNVFSMRSTAS